MKPMLLCLGLALPMGCLAAAVPPQQADVGFVAPDKVPPRPHHPLFEVRYELVSAIPSRHEEVLPVIDLGSAKASIHPVSLEGPGAIAVGGRFRNPNMELCRGWGCEAKPRR
ncbi:hypothetical protein [Dyella lutea]|uniref:Uncharacterized protein n=1 Tax=Dyella lutea TaxID=2950441 RepID=A0ABT1FEA9_9GAMM|nr:hypothetical protein [Dyella lutea]MCP1375721.1 hypothetical protein [Dyella lutea]